MKRVYTIDKPIRLYGIGHAMVDVYARLPHNVPLPSILEYGKAVHLDAHILSSLIDEISIACSHDDSAIFCKTSGGTTANILKMSTSLGAECVFSGTTGSGNENKRDKDAFFFQKECAHAGVKAYLLSQQGSTGRCLAVYEHNAVLKSVAASPAVARSVTTEQIREKEIINADCIVVEGMIFFNESASDYIISLCKKHSKIVCVDLASAFCAAHATNCLCNTVTQRHIPANNILIFANEQEYENIQCNAQDAVEYLLNAGTILIEKRAEKGAGLYIKKEIFNETIQAQPVVDDTGAGDAFAA
ncbi:MAG: PfkB family carbohydrate kinase, partial [Spirochaetales bacterium]